MDERRQAQVSAVSLIVCTVGVKLLVGRESTPRVVRNSILGSVCDVELDTRLVDLSIVEQGLLEALVADRVAHEQAVERIRRLHKLGVVVAEQLARGQSVDHQEASC